MAVTFGARFNQLPLLRLALYCTRYTRLLMEVQVISTLSPPTGLSDKIVGVGTAVTVNVPLSLVQVGLSIGSRFAPELDGLDWQEIADALNSETIGKLVEVEDEEEGKRIQVFVD